MREPQISTVSLSNFFLKQNLNLSECTLKIIMLLLALSVSMCLCERRATSASELLLLLLASRAQQLTI